MAFDINYSRFKCAHLFENIFRIFLEPRYRLYSVSPHADCESNSVHQLFIRMKTELVYIGRRRTTSFSENGDTRVNKNSKYKDVWD